MIDYKYKSDWNATIIDDSKNYHSEIYSCLHQKCPHLSSEQIAELVQNIIQALIDAFDRDGSLHGLFNLLSSCNKRVSPFIATHDYRMRIRKIMNDGLVELNISPIYRLGPDYPDRYQKQYGKELAKEAIIGLLGSPVVELSASGQHAYLLGIDAGMAFKDSKIPHTKKIQLKISMGDQNVSGALHCESETMSKTLTWQQISMPTGRDNAAYLQSAANA